LGKKEWLTAVGLGCSRKEEDSGVDDSFHSHDLPCDKTILLLQG